MLKRIHNCYDAMLCASEIANTFTKYSGKTLKVRLTSHVNERNKYSSTNIYATIIIVCLCMVILSQSLFACLFLNHWQGSQMLCYNSNIHQRTYARWTSSESMSYKIHNCFMCAVWCVRVAAEKHQNTMDTLSLFVDLFCCFGGLKTHKHHHHYHMS